MFLRIPLRALLPARVRLETQQIGKRLSVLTAITAIIVVCSPAIHASGYTATKNTLAILVCDGSSCSAPPFSQAQVENVIVATTYYFNCASYDNIAMTSVVTPWLTISSTDLSDCNTSAIAGDARQAASAAGFNIANYNSF